MTVIPDIKQLVDHFEVPASAWVDACYAVAHSIAREFPELDAVVEEGLWTGVVAEGTHFRPLVDQGFIIDGVGHWWLRLPDGKVLDATRWVFEGVEPYVYHGDADFYRAGSIMDALRL